MESKGNVVQSISSAATSVRKISAVYTHYDFEQNTKVLDYGCGKYFEDSIRFMNNKGNYDMFGYDPYNLQTDVEQRCNFIEEVSKVHFDYIICSCVLNVIKETEIVLDIINDIRKYAEDGTKIIFNIYQGNKSGVGKETSCGWQRNESTHNYVELIQQFLKVTKIKGNFIEACLYDESEREAM